nr:hypothetical protein [Tanacetum cinerariifolium]
MMMRTSMKNPPLDQTGGQRVTEKVKSPNQQVLHQKLLPRAPTGLQQGPDLDRHRQVSLLLQRSLCRLPLRWKSPLIWSLKEGSCKSLIELEYHLEEVYKATTDQLEWVNPEVQQYPHNLLQPLPLIPGNRGRHVIPFAHFINNDLEYLRGGASSRKYTTSVTKMKAADYGHIKWIEYLPLPLIPDNRGRHVIPFAHFINNDLEYLRGGSSSRIDNDIYSIVDACPNACEMWKAIERLKQ